MFIILRAYALDLNQSLLENLSERAKYGDFRRQLFFLKAKYTGYDTLFIDYLTNTRYTLDQVRKADLVALKIMTQDMNIELNPTENQK